MRTLLTGATGRLGSRLAPRLAARVPLRVLVRDPERVAPLWDQGYDVLIGDLRDIDAVKRAVHGVDAVVHLAAVDADTALRLGEAALEAGVRRFVVAGTPVVCGPGADGAPATAVERALLALHRDGGLGLRIVRLASVYGDGDPLPCVTGGPAHRRVPTVHHADVARGLRLVLEADGADGRIFHLADDAALTAWELCALTGQPAPVGAGPVDPWAGLVDTGRIRTELGFRPLYPTVYSAHAVGAV
jgi:nucleoside-diphosphate-sugar epimerase